MPSRTITRTPEARAESRLAKLRRGKLEYKRARWPRSDDECLLRVLTCSEVQECQAHAFRRFKELDIPVVPATMSLFEDECLTQVLFRGCRDPNDPERLTYAIDVDDMRDNTTVDERAAMYTVFRDLCEEQDPDPETVSPELLRQIEEAVKKKDAALLRGFGSSALVSFMLSTDSPPSSSPTGSSGNTE